MKTAIKGTDTILHTGVINFSRQGQKQLYDLLSPSLYAYCLTKTPNEEQAQELLIDGFIKLFMAIKNHPEESISLQECSELFVKLLHDKVSS